MNAEEIELWAEELQNSKLDLIEVLQTHLDTIKELDETKEKLKAYENNPIPPK